MSFSVGKGAVLGSIGLIALEKIQRSIQQLVLDGIERRLTFITKI
ncbi:MAG: hypothetical protein QXN24_08370 [Candidatus Bathyarchaeia archaeon]